MGYRIWTKEEYGDCWNGEEAADLEEVKRLVLDASKKGKEVLLTDDIPFSLEIKVGEPGIRAHTESRQTSKVIKESKQEEGAREVNQGQTKQDKGPGA